MSNRFDRREFARRTVLSSLAAGTAAVAPADAQEQPETQPLQAEQPPLGAPEELLLEVIRQQYASEKLTEEVLNQIRRDIIGHRARSHALKSVALTNAEAPFVFRAYRSTEAAAGETIRIRPRETPEATKSD